MNTQSAEYIADQLLLIAAQAAGSEHCFDFEVGNNFSLRAGFRDNNTVLSGIMYEGSRRIASLPDQRLMRFKGDELIVAQSIERACASMARQSIQFAERAVAQQQPVVTQLSPRQQRVVDEHAECLERLRKLRAFIGDDKGAFNRLDRAERKRLMRQEDVMTDLEEVLANRIAAFMPEAAEADFPLGKACDITDGTCEACQ